MNHYGYYFMFKDIPSYTMGIQISKRPNMPVREEVIDEYNIQGFGTVYKHRQYFKDIEIKFNCNFIVNANLWGEKIIEIQDYLSGIGALFLSDDSNSFYKVKKVAGFEVSRILEKGGTFDLIFTCEPYKYKTEGLEWENIILQEKKTFYNNYNKTFPKIKINGNGTNILIKFEDSRGIFLPVTSGEVLIDTDRGIITKDGILANNLERISQQYDGIKSLYFKKGVNEVTVTGTGVTIEIQPNWRF